jgi:hypothetical protein
MKKTQRMYGLLAASLLALTAACGDEGDCPDSVGGNSIDGSYCAFAELDFDNVRIALFEQSNALDIRYRQGDSTQFVVLASDPTLVFEPGTIGGEFLTVRALPSGGTQLGTVTIDEERSNLVLEEYAGIGARARGEINLLIELRNDSGGRAVTMDATFEGTVVDGEGGF